MIQRSTITLAAAAVVFGAGACGTDDTADDDTVGTEEQEPADEQADDVPEEGGEEELDATAGLDEVHDFGDGFTIQMVDLRRDVEVDGFNSVTGEEGDLSYVAWRFEIANDTGAPLDVGGTTSACYVGDPLEEAEQPVLGTSVNPPDTLDEGQSAQWDVDCWMDEDQMELQYTIDFHDDETGEIRSVTFAGEVD